jgi:hypothetical protein
VCTSTVKSRRSSCARERSLSSRTSSRAIVQTLDGELARARGTVPTVQTASPHTLLNEMVLASMAGRGIGAAAAPMAAA